MTSLLSEASKNRLLRIARDSLHEFLKNNKRKIFTEETPELQTKRAVFLTLRKRDSGDLRGCIGQTEARYPLVEAVAKTAISSAVDDSRFPQVTLNELPKLNIEINVLTEMTTIDPQAVV
ncbi:MAG: AmmeMemoRadiSam system protein A, partial [Deltaproteobacteria bacterium]|nr:AmmeMemoRadiSam system protein A [Deltaproteobacteria bacterium]